MVRHSSGSRIRRLFAVIAIVAGVGVIVAFTAESRGGHPDLTVQQQVERGRDLVIEHACNGCHGGLAGPASDGWLAGMKTPAEEFLIGPCLFEAGAQPCFRTRPRNLTPDNLTGMGRFTERQIFNALRFGLRPGETPDVEITSTTPGVGNFPQNPKYLAPPMPWLGWRHMPDDELWAIAAYLKHGVKPVRNRVADSEGPPDFWASAYATGGYGTYPAPAFPTRNEVMPSGPGIDMNLIRLGRQNVLEHDCGGCHGGFDNPAAGGWLVGVTSPQNEFPFGACATQPGATPCFMQRPRNLTPDDATGIGRYTDRQLFNALRFGLRPSAATDVEITSSTPGQGHFPAHPDYLGPGMPWPAWRHMSDNDLWSIIAYLKHALRPVSNEVKASDAPPDLWASEFTVEKIGPWPAVRFPTSNEVRR
jgi:mono/diheme cytochrome c family protein